MRARRWLARMALVTCVLGFLLASGCSAPPPDSGIRGTVTIGPVSPVARQGESGTRPYKTELAITRPGVRTVKVRSGADGRFEIALPAGTYTIVSARTEAAPPTLGPVTVTVGPHAFSAVTVEFDSGIR